MTGEILGFVSCLVAGGLCLWGGIHEIRLMARLRRFGERAEGVVVDQVPSPEHDHLIPVIAFTDGRGRVVRIRPRVTGSGLGFPLGTRVPVAYLAEQPENARVFTPRHRRQSAVFLIPLGVVFLASGVLIAVNW